MKKKLEKIALLRNSSGSIYHLNLLPGELAETIILVGDPDRVGRVSQHFDSIEIQKQKREFVTHTGRLNNQRISVVSTGIGTDNIDIVINECDALHNVDFEEECVKEKLTTLRFLRLGTCGGIGRHIKVNQLTLSSFAIGIDGLMSFYAYKNSQKEKKLLKAIQDHFNQFPVFENAYIGSADYEWSSRFRSYCSEGVNLTCSGFYGPQSRTLRAPLVEKNFLDVASHFSNEGSSISHVEMETAAIYALSHLLGHQACSISTVLDNHTTKTVSRAMQKAIDHMIRVILSVI